MKAILIDPMKQAVRGVEIQPDQLRGAFLDAKKSIAVDLACDVLSPVAALFYDRNGVLKYPAEFFYIDGKDGPVFGKGLVVGHNDGAGPLSAPMSAKEVEAIVAIIKQPYNRSGHIEPG